MFSNMHYCLSVERSLAIKGNTRQIGILKGIELSGTGLNMNFASCCPRFKAFLKMLGKPDPRDALKLGIFLKIFAASRSQMCSKTYCHDSDDELIRKRGHKT